jgi:hypothetical protein
MLVSGTATECATAAIETVIKSYIPRSTIGAAEPRRRIAGAAAQQINL